MNDNESDSVIACTSEVHSQRANCYSGVRQVNEGPKALHLRCAIKLQSSLGCREGFLILAAVDLRIQDVIGP